MALDPGSLSTSRGGLVAIALSALVGAALGVGGYTFRYAEGLSYLSADPEACVNCHIMQPQYDSWQKAGHHTVAVCVDCHLPPSGLAKWISKAENGWNHSKGFTLQDFPEPIRITAGNAAILQENCLRCHADLLHEQVAGATTDRDAIQCIDCHRSAGHGETLGLGGADQGLEREGSTTR